MKLFRQAKRGPDKLLADRFDVSSGRHGGVNVEWEHKLRFRLQVEFDTDLEPPEFYVLVKDGEIPDLIKTLANFSAVKVGWDEPRWTWHAGRNREAEKTAARLAHIAKLLREIAAQFDEEPG